MNSTDENLLAQIQLLKEKYSASGQDLHSYLEGLLYTDYLNYWDYIHVDVLLNLQTPRTSFPDEKIFIIYHQITELYFKLVLSEMEQISDEENIAPERFLVRMKRINRYFDNLVDSFAVMIEGMDKEQFLKYRMALLPASGFQSAQYRKIEICATDFINITKKESRDKFDASSIVEDMYEEIYWKMGATEMATGNKTLTLKKFEEKYSTELITLIKEKKSNNIWQKFVAFGTNYPEREKLVLQLRTFDLMVNVYWPMVHLGSAQRYLQKDPVDIAATGGTNWQKYLPPHFQKRIFYPELWEDEEKDEWGKGGIPKMTY